MFPCQIIVFLFYEPLNNAGSPPKQQDGLPRRRMHVACGPINQSFLTSFPEPVTLIQMPIWPLFEEKAFSFHPTFPLPLPSHAHNLSLPVLPVTTSFPSGNPVGLLYTWHSSQFLFSATAPAHKTWVEWSLTHKCSGCRPRHVILSLSSGCITMFCTGIMALECVLHCKGIYLTFQVQELLSFSTKKTPQSQCGIFVASCSETAPPINFCLFSHSLLNTFS